ncbi:MAG TPA: hypothetical protein EYQ60_17410 [Myxococcales bacterium]|nr:hypothetical protein [Myxococcales bacterium]
MFLNLCESIVFEPMWDTPTVMMWAWGVISPQILQHIMFLFIADIACAEQNRLNKKTVRRLAALGTEGRHGNNIHHELLNMMPETKMPKPHSFLTPLRHNVLGFINRGVDMILPHELFAALYHYYPQAWLDRICPSAETCRRFWGAVRGSVQFMTHPVRHRPNFMTRCIPLTLHGDGTPVVGIGKAWGRLMDIWSWTSILATGPTILRAFMVFCLHTAIQCVRAGHNTLDVVFKKMAWSFTAMWVGKWPTHDWNGGPMHYPARGPSGGDDLAGGFFCAIWALIGDLDYWRAYLRLPNSTSNTPCAICPCNVSDCPWYDFRTHAVWLGRIYDTAAWTAAGMGMCVLFTIPGVTNHSLHPDWMHAKHLGTDKVLHNNGHIEYLNR